ncbi:hypothetical protein BOTBODRAFT_188668 [Botryobasidium botryosum FD-172 SS1]|uniref:General negative regulator of transcription subunit 1 n=1 Tax=Botryobasidium botryosum (strain FD-172 SS1) TaxID=930990 RepID=A0A067MC40_BOTB1|nr:hypothetical protein BOTBODRAFT_188668 [Botryobasidium botryosum FD-172 SS1]
MNADHLPPPSHAPRDARDSANPANNSLLTIVKAQIVFLLSTLTEENFDRNQVEIRSLSEQHGIETYLHFIRRLIVASQTRLSTNAPPQAFDASSTLTFRLLVQETQRLARDPFLADRFRDAVDRGEGDIFRHFDLVRFSDRIGLRPLEKLVLASSIVSATLTRKELATQAVTIIRVDFENAVLSLCQHPSFDHADLSPAQVAKLLSHLLSDPPPDSPVLDASQRLALIVAAQAKYGMDIMAPVLQQIFPTLSLSPGTSLVQTLIQLGPDITNDPETIRALLLRFGISDASPPHERQVGEIISTLARYAAEGTSLCDVSSLMRAFSSFSTPIHWPTVVCSFDRPDHQAVDTATLKLLIAVLLNPIRESDTPAVDGFWQPWKNPLYQLRLLDALLSLPNDTFNFVSLPGRRIVTVEDVATASPTIKALAANVQGHTWNSLDLIQVLVSLAELESPEVKHYVREMLDKAVKISAELVHMGLLQIAKPWNALHAEYAAKLLAMFLAGHPNHQLVFMRIWQIDPTYLTSAFRGFYDESPLNITRILDIAQDLKILDSLLEVRPFGFALDVAALASRREYLNLDKWLADNVNAHGEAFTRAVMDFLELKISSELQRQDPQVEQRTMSLNPQTVAIFIRVLRSSNLAPADNEYFTEIRNQCCQLHPRLMNLSPGSDAEPGLTVVTFSAEIEAEVESIYKQMYEEHIAVDHIIALLQQYKVSNNPRDKEIFACTLHSLFDEYKFFQQYYPARELAMTAYLFGSLIQYQLIDYIPLGIAIRYVLDAIRNPPDTNLFKFGVQALSRFESRLPEWPQLCRALLQLSHLEDARPDLADIARRALTRSEEVNFQAETDRTVAPDRLLEGPSVQPISFTAIQPDVLPDAEEITVPEEETSDKILFIVNNIAPNNFDSKVEEMKKRFQDDYSRWFANYLVDQRVSSEPNNHQLYLRLLDALESKPLFKYVLHETFVKSAQLLNAEKTLQSSSERTMLKNLGAWLGSLTLARNRPIKHRNLSFKDLLLEGFDNNRLIVAIPFVCVVLEQCAKSKVFLPPNPWLMAVISLLAELYHFAELKLNPKFQIEVLCKGLGIDLDEVEATTVLRNRPLTEPIAGLPLPEFVADMDQLPITGFDSNMQAPSDPQAQQQQIIQLPRTSPNQTPQSMGLQIETLLSSIPTLVTVSQQLAPLSSNATFKRAIQVAIEQAVREIILPVVERSVTIAGISTRELVSKDFALESNEDKMQKAAHLMAQNLAGSLALVTCKEPLRSNMMTHLRHLLNEHGFTDQMVPEQVIMLIVADNIDMACNIIEKAAMDRAVAEVDEGFAAAYNSRRRHREQRPGQPFWDTNSSPSGFAASLPDVLRVKPVGLQLQQSRVYEDFDTKRFLQSQPGSAVAYGRAEIMQHGNYHGSTPAPEEQDSGMGMGSNTLSLDQCLERFSQLISELDRLIAQTPAQADTSLPLNPAIRHLNRQIILIAAQAGEEAALVFSQKIVQLLYKTPLPLAREVYVVLLDNLCQSSAKVAKEVVGWFIFAEDERKFNVPVTVVLLHGGVIPFAEFDHQMAKVIIRDYRPNVVDFSANLIRECLFGETPCASRNQFAFMLEALHLATQSGKGTEAVVHLMNELRPPQGPSRPSTVPPSAQIDKALAGVYEQLSYFFAEWVRLFQRSPSAEKSFVGWVTQLTAQGILKGEEISSFFFRVCTETSMELYNKHIASGDVANAYQPIDALSRLIGLMIKYNGDAAATKIHYLTKILSIVVLVLAHAHEEHGADFDQKPFFRLFSSLFSDLHSIESSLLGTYFQLLLALCDTFGTLQPTYFPGFAFSWMSLVSHRLFMPKLLLSENREGWPAFHRLLICLLKFLAPFLRKVDMRNSSRNLFRGALRLLLVLLHDFPEFLSEYYFTICDVIPSRCIQLRNVVLSAFPSSLRLPDPHLRDINLDTLPEMGPIPPILSDFTTGLSGGDLRGALDQYLLNRGSPSFLASIKDALLSTRPSTDPSAEKYNLTLINALVMYVGVSSVAQAKARSGSSLFVSTDAGPTLLLRLSSDLDAEGQHHLLSAMVIHLRYPNAHTHWFSSLLLFLFLEVRADRFQEIATKVLLERFIVHRPHPWGALVTFIELLRNPKYDFWNKEFVRVAPEITMLLDSVSRSLV